MKFSRPLLLVVFFLAFLQVQCLLVPDDTEKGTMVTNQRPTVRITAGASNPDTLGLDYKVLFRWNGVDVDGVVSLFQYAVDDTVTEGAWRDTTDYSARIAFRAETGDPDPGHETRFTDWHTFYIRAVDNEGATSLPDHRFFNAVTIAPKTTIKFPSGLPAIASLQQTIVVRWEGEDLDSSNPERQPVAWEFKLAPVNDIVNDTNEDIKRSIRESDNLLLDTLRVGDKTRWIRVPHDQSSLRLANLIAGSQLAFAVRAVDEAGAIEPSLDRDQNFIAFIVTGQTGKPLVTVRDPGAGETTFGQGPNPWRISVPSGRELRFTWTGDALYYGSEAGNSNYGLDIPDPEDETLRDPNGVGGWIGWGRWLGTTRPIVFSSAEAGQEHSFWVKMRDISETRESERLCEVRIFVVPFTFEKLALILDDSKFQSSHPTDAEHDAFIEQVLARRFLDFGQPDQYSLWGDPEGSQPRGAADLKLETIAAYQFLLWHVNLGTNSGSNLPLNTVESGRRLLSTYLSAGGRMMIVGGRLGSHLTGGTFGYPKDAPDPDDEGDSSGDYSNKGFLWNFMRVRNQLVSVRTSAPPAETQSSGLVLAKSLHAAYPDIPINFDPYEVNNGRFRGGMSDWEGVLGQRRIEHFVGLDSLYAPVTFDTTFSLGPYNNRYDDAVIGWRYQSTRADTLAGTVQGRIVVMDFQPYFFDAGAVQDAGTVSVNWLMTGRDH